MEELCLCDSHHRTPINAPQSGLPDLRRADGCWRSRPSYRVVVDIGQNDGRWQLPGAAWWTALLWVQLSECVQWQHWLRNRRCTRHLYGDGQLLCGLPGGQSGQGSQQQQPQRKEAEHGLHEHWPYWPLATSCSRPGRRSWGGILEQRCRHRFGDMEMGHLLHRRRCDRPDADRWFHAHNERHHVSDSCLQCRACRFVEFGHLQY